MLKSELIHTLSEKIPTLHFEDVDLAINCILELMSEALATGERIEIRGFGSFDAHTRPPRIGRNPRSGVAVEVATKRKVHFKPGKELRDRVDASRDCCAIED